MLKVKPQIMKILPYTPGKSKAEGFDKVIKLSSNENALGASPKAIKAYRDFDAFNRYPDATSANLREAIGKAHGLDDAKIMCGSGSDEILGLIAHGFLSEGDEAIYTRHGFLVYPIAILAAGAAPVIAEEKNYTTDVDAILKCVTPKTRVVFLANPNNPTGTYIADSEMQRLRKGLRDDILLVIDSAYAECASAADYKDGREIVDAGANTIMPRTFSKIYGLAALRLGWAYAHPSIIDVLNRIRPVFNINLPAQMAGIAALEDKDFFKRSLDHNVKWRDILTQSVQGMGYEVLPSQTNFITVKFGDGNAAFEFLKSKGILVREIGGYSMPEFLRISFGTDEENEFLLKCLQEYKR